MREKAWDENTLHGQTRALAKELSALKRTILNALPRLVRPLAAGLLWCLFGGERQ